MGDRGGGGGGGKWGGGGGGAAGKGGGGGSSKGGGMMVAPEPISKGILLRSSNPQGYFSGLHSGDKGTK